MAFLKTYTTPADTDEALVNQYRQTGDLLVLGTLYNKYMELVYGVCLKYFKEPEKAKDGVMAIFEELVTKLKKHEIVNFRGWLQQVAKNYCLMQLRSPRNLKLTSAEPDENMQLEEKLHHEDMEAKEMQFKIMEACIETLNGAQKQAVSLFYLEEKCYNEIVEITGEEWNKVRSLIQNARRNLKICMEQKMKNEI